MAHHRTAVRNLRLSASFLLAPSLLLPAGPVLGGSFDPSDPAYSGRRGVVLHVSKLGDGSDGTSWERAFPTIQAALLALPDASGGHRIVIRPDTYVEANLYPAHPGAAGAYNLLAGDSDGRLGSGATGWVVIDTGVPDRIVRQKPSMEPGEAGGNPGFVVEEARPETGPQPQAGIEGGTGSRIEPGPQLETGLKSVDWWGPWRCDPSYSAIGWDRWIFRGLYATGSEGGMGWDLTTRCGSEFSAVVEECVGLGRFAGAAAIGQKLRPGEPVVFRRSYFACLDVWGDAGGVYVRSHDPSMPETPGVIFEDSTIVGPDNALQVGYPGFEGYSRVKFKGCRLIVLNFSQPHGTPATGIVYSDLAGKYLHVELEDCACMGYKVLGARDDDLFSHEVKGRVSAYVQYRQPVPAGFERTPLWPVELFRSIGPPEAPGALRGAGRTLLTKLPFAIERAMENTPVVFDGRPLLVLNHRDDTKNGTDEYTESMFLAIRDLATGAEVARFGQGHSFASAFVGPASAGPEAEPGSDISGTREPGAQTLHVFASEGTDRDWFQSIWRFSSTDLKTWTRELAVEREGAEHLFNVSVTRGEPTRGEGAQQEGTGGEGTRGNGGYVMAYESSLPVKFCFKFARSDDLARWEKIPGLVFAGTGDEYSACPVLRYVRPYYHVIYLHEAPAGKTGWVSFAARSRDLVDWELSPRNPILEAGPGEGTNNSDVDLFEHEGNTYLFYATGDQATWGAVRPAMFPGTVAELFESLYPPGVPTVKVSARRGPSQAPEPSPEAGKGSG